MPFVGQWKTKAPVEKAVPPKPQPKAPKPKPNPEQELQRQLGGRTGEVIRYCQANNITDRAYIEQLVCEAYVNEKKSENYVRGRVEFAIKTILKK